MTVCWKQLWIQLVPKDWTLKPNSCSQTQIRQKVYFTCMKLQGCFAIIWIQITLKLHRHLCTDASLKIHGWVVAGGWAGAQQRQVQCPSLLQKHLGCTVQAQILTKIKILDSHCANIWDPSIYEPLNSWASYLSAWACQYLYFVEAIVVFCFLTGEEWGMWGLKLISANCLHGVTAMVVSMPGIRLIKHCVVGHKN